MLKLVCVATLLICASADVSHLRVARIPQAQVVAFVPNAPPAAPRSYSPERDSTILRQSQDISPDGSYQYAYETSNGIAAQEEGRPVQISPQEQAENVQGSYSYTSPEGERVDISYVADQNGYQPQGNVLPTPPPVPAAIQRALEYIARNPPPSQ